jgi:hypothetical protein
MTEKQVKSIDELKRAVLANDALLRLEWPGGRVAYLRVEEYVELSARDLVGVKAAFVREEE